MIWTASVDGPDVVAPGSVVRVRVDARPTGGWYFYSLTQPAGGPVPARIWLADSTTFKPGGPVSGPQPATSFDNIFGINVEKYPAAASFTLSVRVPMETSAGAREIRVSAQYQACNDTVCLSPRTVTMGVPLQIEPR
ncbi:MAG: protein-disulfide reductase DsbD domain-containing protein [Gemmatimonadaceae bacterium]